LIIRVFGGLGFAVQKLVLFLFFHEKVAKNGTKVRQNGGPWTRVN